MKIKLAVIIILLLAIFMRFYHLPGLLHWTMDEDYWSYIPYNIATGYHLPLIGGSIADTGLYTTPWFVYLMAVVAFLGQGNPLAFGAFVSSLGVLTTFLVWNFGKQMFSNRVAIIASFLYAISVLGVLWDRHYWNASLTPILTLLTLDLLYRAISSSTKALIVLAFVLALAVSAHGAGVALVILRALSLLIFRPRLPKKSYLFALLLLFVSFTPLLLFDFRHNFLEVRSFIGYFVTHKSSSEGFLTRIIDVFQNFVITAGKLLAFSDNNDVSSQLTLGDTTLNHGQPLLLSLLMFLSAILYWPIRIINRKKISPAETLLFLALISPIIGLLIFHSPISSYYYSPLEIPLFFLIAIMLDKFLHSWYLRPLAGIVVIFLTVYSVTKLLVTYHSDPYSRKLAAVEKTLDLISTTPFRLDVRCVSHCQLYGYRYLFTYLRDEPVQSYIDGNFDWLYHNRLLTAKPQKDVTLLVGKDFTTVEVTNEH